MRLKPIGERVILKPLKTEEKTASGIYLPKGTDEKKRGEVVAAGFLRHGRPIPLRAGDKVIYGGYSSEEIEVDGNKFLIVEFKDVLAKMEDN